MGLDMVNTLLTFIILHRLDLPLAAGWSLLGAKSVWYTTSTFVLQSHFAPFI